MVTGSGVGSSLNGIFRYITIHSPRFLGLTGGMFLAVVTMGIANATNQPGILLLAIAATLIFGFLLALNLWAAHKHANTPDYQHLFQMARLGQNDTFVLLELGEKTAVLNLYPQLTGGKITAIDIYNPLLTPDPSLPRARAYFSLPPTKDPRLNWQDGHFSRLSLPNNSVSTILLPHVVSQLAEWGDQKLLLQEVYRLLKPGGRLLLAEQIRTPTQWILNAWSAGTLEPASVWHELVTRMGFVVKEETVRFDLSLCLLAEKPERAMGKQLSFEFPIQ